MTQDAAAGVVLPIWKSWAAKFMFQRALFKEQVADFGGKRVRAEKRAAAAELIAQEANAARLKALLDAAREQAAVETIRSAEQRFADAKVDWETAQEAFHEPANDLLGEGVDEPLPAAGDGRAVWRWGWANGAVPRRRAILSFAGIAAIIAAGVFLYLNVDRLEGGERAIAGSAMPTSDAAVETVATAATDIDPPIPVDGKHVVPMSGAEFPAALETGAKIEVDAPNTAPRAKAEPVVQTRAKFSIRTRRRPTVEPAPPPPRNPYRAVSTEPDVGYDPFLNDDVE